ncbi:C39 family peptidase [Priestia filamentosa]|uniref:C39 family peptidase n=1 Tax=Priestia filamentosa TaxID=1402861 RepID=UPI003D2A2CD5
MRKKAIVFSVMTLILASGGFATQANAFSSSTPITQYGSTGSPDDPDNFIKLINDVPDYSSPEFFHLGYDNNCYPTALTNLILYWDKKYQSLVQHRSSPPDQDRVTNRISYLTGFNNTGLSHSKAKQGLQAFIAEKELADKMIVKSSRDVDIKTVEQQIYKGNPLILGVDRYKFNGHRGFEGGGGHAVIITGVIRVGETTNLIIQDGWLPTSKILIINWDDVVEMGIQNILYIDTYS